MMSGLVLMFCLLQEKELEKPERFDPLEKALGIPVNGYLSAKYRLRAAGEGDKDQDLYEYLSLDVADPEKHPFSGHLFLRATEDLDSNTGDGAYQPFNDLTSTYSSFNARFYEGYVNAHRLGPVELIRAGRQFTYETPVMLHFDGGRIETKTFEDAISLKFGAYGGVPVHLFESSASGDWLFGAFAEARPFKGNRVRIDFIHTNDERDEETLDDNYLGFGVWQAIGTQINAQAHFSLLNGNSRELDVRVGFVEPDWKLTIDVYWHQLFKKEELLTIENDNFFLAMFEYFPYMQGGGTITKGFGENFMAVAGIDVRDLTSNDDYGPFNHDYIHWYAGPMLTDWPVKGLSASIYLDFWSVAGEDGDIWTLSFDLTHKFSKEFKASIGTNFAAFKYDYFSDIEKENVQTYYIKATYLLNKQYKFDLGYEYEDADIDNFHTLKIGVGYSF